jgi:beta-glucanase (GH16 family)
MLLEDWESRPRSPRKKDSPGAPKRGPSRRVVAAVAIAVAIVVVAGAGTVAVKLSSHHSQSPPPVAAKLKTATTPAVAPPKSWRLTFDSDFSGSKLDTQVWGTCYPAAQPTGCTNYGNPADKELEWYQSSQDHVSGGALQLTAQHEPTPGFAQDGAAQEYACRSGMVTTYPSLRFEYGFLQVTAKIPFGKGLWPAFWLAAANGKWPPEVDIFEHWHSETVGKVYLHPLSGPRQGGPVPMPRLASGWHTFTLSWTKNQLTWYYDGTKVLSATTGIPRQSMYLIMNLADDAAGTGSCSGSLSIKSVKLWQPSN